MFCSECGKELKPGKKFCIYCGEPIPIEIQEAMVAGSADSIKIGESQSTYDPDATEIISENYGQETAIVEGGQEQEEDDGATVIITASSRDERTGTQEEVKKEAAIGEAGMEYDRQRNVAGKNLKYTGHVIDEAGAQRGHDRAIKQDSKKSSSSVAIKILIVVLILLILVAIGLATYFFMENIKQSEKYEGEALTPISTNKVGEDVELTEVDMKVEEVDKEDTESKVVEEDDTDEEEPEYVAIYSEFLRNYDYKRDYDGAEEARFDLIYIDDDDTPELAVADWGNHPSGVSLYTISDDKLIDLGVYGEFGWIEYKDHGNIIHTMGTGMGEYADFYYSIKNTKIESIVDLSLFTGSTIEEEGMEEYRINDKVVTKQEYEQKKDQMDDQFSICAHEDFTYAWVDFEVTQTMHDINEGNILQYVI